MINPFKDVNWQPDLAAKRSFAKSLVIGFPCVAVALLLLRWLSGAAWPPARAMWIGGVGAGAGVLLYALPVIAKPFYLVWYFLSCCIGIVVSNTLLAGFFYLVVTPFGLLKRVVSRKNLTKGFDRQAPSYWKPAETVTDLSRYYRQF